MLKLPGNFERIRNRKRLITEKMCIRDRNKANGSEQQGERPVVIIQNDIGNLYSSTVIVAAITAKINKRELPVHVELSKRQLKKNSTILLEQIRTLDKKKLKEKVGNLNSFELKNLNKALKISVGL